jgi:ferric-dicitrate binding protein FerR (iron transport regulator)
MSGGEPSERPTAEPAPAEEPRPRRPRRRRRALPLGIALLLVAGALLVGILVGYAARGGGSSEAPVTVERELPVVTVTVQGPVGR